MSGSPMPRIRAMGVEIGPVAPAPPAESHAAVRRDSAADKNKPSRIQCSLRLGMSRSAASGDKAARPG
ncbi:hypothetical protein [Azohydromonas caseinilytica]|uniref:Uncharacterized protein n=1 Tax=Azohydromonas caseinilytica TaxID=2728836 RepID=A0A848FHA5_9BURK|nr:hypothetical protein [Azohydromonas caseinilytica]NML18526.1 hypothetical protein [Azohydromonas caseinilytica]